MSLVCPFGGAPSLQRRTRAGTPGTRVALHECRYASRSYPDAKPAACGPASMRAKCSRLEPIAVPTACSGHAAEPASKPMRRTQTSVRHVTVPRAGGPTRSLRRRLAGGVAAAVLCLCCPAAASAQDPAWRLELDALLQEGELVRDELDRLQPQADDLAKEGAQLDAEDQALRTASQALNDDIRAFNTAVDDLQKAAQAQQARCPRESEDSALVEACNVEAARIREQANARDTQRPLLKQRQEDLNRRIAQHNSARRDWAARKTRHDGLMDLNRRDLVGWLERAQRYFDSGVFQTRYRAAGDPAACRPEGLHNLAATPGRGTLERVHGCLLAIREGP
jgi:hypothetical protein